MTTRTRIFITVISLCHLFLLPAVVISQLQAEPPASSSSLLSIQSGEEVTIKAREQEKQGSVYKLRGEAEVDFRTYVLKADEMSYDDSTGEVTLTGNVTLDGGPHDEHIKASHGSYNIHTDSGKFYDVVGSTGARVRGRGVMLTTSNPFFFTGSEVEKIGRDKFIVRDGRVTSCMLPKPKWTFGAHEVDVIAGENAKMYHSTFRFFGIPLFYFPFVEHPVERVPRQSGFLLPHIGNSTLRGFTFGEAFYWAINRSMDATLGAEFYSRRGWGQHGTYRWRPTETAFLNFDYSGVLDRGAPITQTIFVPGVGNTTTNLNPGGEEVRINGEAELPYGFRGVADVDYLSKFLYRAVYAEHFTEAINTEVKSIAFVSRMKDGYSLNGWAARYQNFQSIQSGDVVTIVHAPSGEFSGIDRKLGNSPFYWAFDTAAEGLSRRQPSFVTNDVVGRFDAEPSISLPLHWKGWSLRPQVSLLDTYYTERATRLADGTVLPVTDPVNRRAVDAVVELRPPALMKVFAPTVFNHKIKHTFEPHVRYEKVNGVNNFNEILRFDYRDILSDTNEVEYGFVNRLYAKRVNDDDCKSSPESVPEPSKQKDPYAEDEDTNTNAEKSKCVPYAREIISWELAQKYFFDPTFGGALVSGQRNVFTTTANFTGIAFLFEPRRFSPITSRLRINRGARADVDWQLDFDTFRNRINSSLALVNFRMKHDVAISAGHAYLLTPEEMSLSTATPNKFNQFRTQITYGNLNRRGMNIAGVVGYDVYQGQLQYATVQTTYNWDCCGFTFEYRRFKFGTIRDESQYRFALTLANIATFGTMRKQERLF